MKKIILLLVTLVFAGNVFAQTNELSVQISSGLFSYGGKSAVRKSYLFINDTPPNYNVNSPFGKKSAFSYGAAMQVQHITKKSFILGFRLGYDQQAASTGIDEYSSMGGTFKIKNGKAILRNQVIQINPYVGYRVPVKQVKVDLTAGLNLGLIRNSNSYVTFDDQNNIFDDKIENGKINTKADFGPEAGVAVSYKKFAVSATYIYGLINYQRMMDGANPEVYARYLRIGLAYKIF